jgi:hypothetical protein
MGEKGKKAPRDAAEVKSAVRRIEQATKGATDIWPEELMRDLNHGAQLERIIGWKEGMDWVLRRRVGNREIREYLEGNLNDSLPDKLRCYPEEAEEGGSDNHGKS